MMLRLKILPSGTGDLVDNMMSKKARA